MGDGSLLQGLSPVWVNGQRRGDRSQIKAVQTKSRRSIAIVMIGGATINKRNHAVENETTADAYA